MAPSRHHGSLAPLNPFVPDWLHLDSTREEPAGSGKAEVLAGEGRAVGTGLGLCVANWNWRP